MFGNSGLEKKVESLTLEVNRLGGLVEKLLALHTVGLDVESEKIGDLFKTGDGLYNYSHRKERKKE